MQLQNATTILKYDNKTIILFYYINHSAIRNSFFNYYIFQYFFKYSDETFNYI